MNLDELKIQVQKDLKIDDEHLDTESLKNQEIKATYLDHKSRYELLLFKAKGDYKILFKDKWEYYVSITSYKKGNHVSGNHPMILTDGAEPFTEMTLTTEDIVDKFISPNVTEIDANLAPNKVFDGVVHYDYTTTHVFDQETDVSSNEVFQGQKNKDNAKLERQAMMEILQQHTMVVTIPFRTDISCGTIINLELPEPQLASGSDVKDKLNDGRYLITDICFQGNVLDNGGVCNIECVKESFAKTIASINPQDSMEAPEDI